MKSDYISRNERLDFKIKPSQEWRKRKIERLNKLIEAYAMRRSVRSKLIMFIFNRKQ